MKIRTIIIDDEAPNRQNLTHLIGKYCPDVVLIGEADSAASGIDIISQNYPDLVFLDIRMPGGNAFEMLGNIPDINFEIIFITLCTTSIKAQQFKVLLITETAGWHHESIDHGSASRCE